LKKITLLNFIKKVKPDIKYDLANWAKQLKVKELINNVLIKEVLTKFPDNNTLHIEGAVFGVKEVMEKIKANHDKEIKFVSIFNYDTLYIDDDLINPGISTAILAKDWKVYGDRKISLKGKDAQNFEFPAQSVHGQNKDGSGKSGINGIPGEPGESGGSFFGKVMLGGKITGIDKLLIDIRGGDGGNGQDGGDGSNGCDGKDAALKPVNDRDPKCLVGREEYNWSKKETTEKLSQVWKTVGTFNGQMLETYRSVGKKGKRGGDGGQGGAGGKGGLTGRLIFDNIPAHIYHGNGG